ncbi:MAG: T9SS type A sorting domain-containing protein [bacterium]
MIRWRVFAALVAVAVIMVGQAAAQHDPCDIPPGIYRTQTQGGWGGTCHGQNPGCLRDAHFDEAFPTGLTVGGTFTIHLTSSAAVENFLPAGTTPNMLTSNHINPVSTEAGVFAGQVVTLAISLGFSEVGLPGFGDLGSLVVLTGVHSPSGPFAGYTVDEVFALANIVLGGNLAALPEGISLSDLNDVIDAINNNFIDGEESNGYLVEENCDDILPVELMAEPTVTPGNGQLTLTFSVADEHDVILYEILRDGAKVTDLEIANGSYSYEDRNLMNGRRYEYSIWALELGQRRLLSYDGKTVWAGVPSTEPAVVAEYALYQNHPNPFNPETSISYDLKESGIVTLKVYDMLGREIATLVNGEREAGRHTILFSAANLPSGVYLYRMDVNGYIALKKMTVLK